VNGSLLMRATAVAIDDGAVLLRGGSGSGKSDLALRLIDAGGQLIADDQTLLRRDGDRVVATAPPAIAGLIEVRGIGLVRIKAAPDPVPLVLVVDLILTGDIERMPEPRVETVLGVTVAAIEIAPFQASAAAKLRLLRHALAGGPLPAIIDP
jgi:HPr kinase/phosphorylase